MATRSLIAKVLPDGGVVAVYCHNSGYVVGGVGETLVCFYEKEWKVDELLELGSLSSLGAEVHPSTDQHTFDTPEPEVTIAYHRDRGEPYHAPLECKSPRALALYATKFCMGIEYFYYYDNGEWFVREPGGPLKRVTDVLSW